MRNSNYYVSYTGPYTNTTTVFPSYSQTFRNISIPFSLSENCQNLQSYEKSIFTPCNKKSSTK